MQRDYIRTQLRLPQGLHEEASKAAKAANLSLNELYLQALQHGLRTMQKPRRRLIYTQWQTGRDPEHRGDYLLQAADRLTAFLREHPAYELVTVESLPTGLRCWYTYPIDADGREIPHVVELED